MNRDRDLDVSHNTSNSSYHYAELLRTVSDLRADLEKTTSKIKSLEEQNYSLSNNYGVIKEELIDTRKKYNEAKESYVAAVAEKFEIERKHETFIDRLKIQLAEKTKEFEVIRDKLIPHDIDQLRIKVQEELEIQHKQELKHLENEVETQRDKFFALKREMERTKSEYNSLTQNQQQEIYSLRAEKEAIEDHYRREGQTLLSLDPSLVPFKDDKIRQQANKSAEFSHLCDRLREEAVQLRKEKDNAVYLLEETKSKYDQLINNLRTKIAIIESERSGFQERISRLETDNEKKEVTIRGLKSNNEELTDQIDSSLKIQEELQRQLSSIRADYTNQIDLLKDDHHQEVTEMNENIISLNNKVAEREDFIRRLQREISELQLRSESTENEVRRAHYNQLQDIRKKNTSMELENVENKQNIRLMEEQISIIEEQHILEKDSLVSELSRMKREKEFLHSKIRELDSVIESHRKKNVSIQQDYYLKLSTLEKRLRENNALITNLEIKNESLNAKNNELEKEKIALSESYYRLEQQNNELLSRIEATKKDFQVQLDSLAPAFKERADELKQQLKGALSKERKRADAYKAKALEAHNKVKTLIESSSGRDY